MILKFAKYGMLIPESTSDCSRIWMSITSNNSSFPAEEQMKNNL